MFHFKHPEEETTSWNYSIARRVSWDVLYTGRPSKPVSRLRSLPYIKGLTEPLTRLLRSNGIRTTSRPLKTFQQEFIAPKSRPPVDQQTNVVYKIPFADCSWTYIRETGRCLKTRVRELFKNTKAFKFQHTYGWITTPLSSTGLTYNRQGKFPR